MAAAKPEWVSSGAGGPLAVIGSQCNNKHANSRTLTRSHKAPCECVRLYMHALVWSYLSSLIISFVAFSFCLSCCLSLLSLLLLLLLSLSLLLLLLLLTGWLFGCLTALCVGRVAWLATKNVVMCESPFVMLTAPSAARCRCACQSCRAATSLTALAACALVCCCCCSACEFDFAYTFFFRILFCLFFVFFIWPNGSCALRLLCLFALCAAVGCRQRRRRRRRRRVQRPVDNLALYTGRINMSICKNVCMYAWLYTNVCVCKYVFVCVCVRDGGLNIC